MHVYFADKPLEEMEHGTAGVRADHPVEVVVSTKEVLEAGLTLFYTQSEGVLCRSEIPAFTILQVRDTRDDEILYIKAFPEAEPEPEMDARPEPAEEIEEIEAEPERPETPRASTASAAPTPALSLPQGSAVTEANQERRGSRSRAVSNSSRSCTRCAGLCRGAGSGAGCKRGPHQMHQLPCLPHQGPDGVLQLRNTGCRAGQAPESAPEAQPPQT